MSHECAPVGCPELDRDPDVGQSLTFRITGGDIEATQVFSINACSGQVTVKRAVLDHEKTGTYMLTIEVTDDGVNPDELSDTADIYITINDVNEAPVLADTSLSVFENVLADAAVGDPLEAHDEDEDPDDVLTYSIVSGNDLGFFAVHPTSGAVTVTPAGNLKLDHEGQATFSLVVKVVDEHGLSDTADVLIEVRCLRASGVTGGGYESDPP